LFFFYFLFPPLLSPSFMKVSIHLSLRHIFSSLSVFLFLPISLTGSHSFFDAANFRDSFLPVIFRAIYLQLLSETLPPFFLLLFQSTPFLFVSILSCHFSFASSLNENSWFRTHHTAMWTFKQSAVNWWRDVSIRVQDPPPPNVHLIMKVDGLESRRLSSS
jgi:hypothetical protein